MKNKSILISGAGIAGLTLAYWLEKCGFEPVVIEKRKALPEGGYMIDFFGTGVDVLEKMGLMEALGKVDANMKEVKFVNKKNERVGGMDVLKFKEMFDNRAFNLHRSSLVKLIHDRIENKVRIRYGTTIKSLDVDPTGVWVTYHDNSKENFHLVAGADGLHSNVRTLTMGNESEFERWFGYYTSSFTVENFLKDDKTFYSYTIPGKQIALYPFGDNKLVAFFVFRSNNKVHFDSHDNTAQKEMLKDEYNNVGWYSKEILSSLSSSSDFYFDSVSQIRMDQWYKDRVCLVGDACDCPSLLSGQGASVAATGAYVLAEELYHHNGEFQQAFKSYQSTMKPFADQKQRVGEKFAASFVPYNQFDLWIRNTFTNLMFIPLVSQWFKRQFLSGNLNLSDRR